MTGAVNQILLRAVGAGKIPHAVVYATSGDGMTLKRLAYILRAMNGVS